MELAVTRPQSIIFPCTGTTQFLITYHLLKETEKTEGLKLFKWLYVILPNQINLTSSITGTY